jgi:hypothetical protein
MAALIYYDHKCIGITYWDGLFFIHFAIVLYYLSFTNRTDVRYHSYDVTCFYYSTWFVLVYIWNFLEMWMLDYRYRCFNYPPTRKVG